MLLCFHRTLFCMKITYLSFDFHGIRYLFQYRSGVVRANIYVGGGGLIFLNGLKVSISELSVISRKLTIFMKISILSPSNLNALIFLNVSSARAHTHTHTHKSRSKSSQSHSDF